MRCAESKPSSLELDWFGATRSVEVAEHFNTERGKRGARNISIVNVERLAKGLKMGLPDWFGRLSGFQSDFQRAFL